MASSASLMNSYGGFNSLTHRMCSRTVSMGHTAAKKIVNRASLPSMLHSSHWRTRIGGQTNVELQRVHTKHGKFSHVCNAISRPISSEASAEVLDNLGIDPAAEREQEEHINWKDAWYAVSFMDDLPEHEPYAFTLLEEPIVVWKEPRTGQWRCFRDACPHRLVPLSEGRIDPSTGNLECPYHGWQFNHSGACTSMPEGGDCTNVRACATVYPVAVRQGMLFVKPMPLQRKRNCELDCELTDANGESVLDMYYDINTSDIPIVPELEDPDTLTLDIARDFPYDYSLLMENLLDVGHVHFTHHGTISRREKAPVVKLEVDERSKAGFSGRNLDGSVGKRDSEFVAPAFMRHVINNWQAKGSVLQIVVYAVPISPGKCRLLNRQVFQLKSSIARTIIRMVPKWMYHIQNNVILDDDVIFLHRQMKEFVHQGASTKPVSQIYYMPTSSDAFVLAFHTWLNRYAGGGPFGPIGLEWLQRAGPQLNRDQLLDRYHTHTETCTSCRNHLKRLKLIQAIAFAAATIGAVVMCIGASIGALVASSAMGVSAAVNMNPRQVSTTTAVGIASWIVEHVPVEVVMNVVLAATILMLLASSICIVAGKQQHPYYKGDWPPPRNTVA